MKLHVDDVLDGKYRILRVLGRGGVGSVYEAENVQIRRRVAIKVLHATLAKKAEAGARFQREAQAAARVGSDRICEVLDFGTLAEGANYLVMEYLDGQSLAERLRGAGGRLAPEVIVPIVADLLEGLEDAHEAGIIHRDLKPDNIFLCRPRRGHGDFVKILDFGISKFMHGGDDHTMTGVLMGTPYYMSPEQGRGFRNIDHRADLYAVGAILFRCLTGQHHVEADALGDLLKILLTEDAPRVDSVDPALDAGLADIVARALSRSPRERHPDAVAMRVDLLQWLEVRGLPLIAGSRDGLRVSSTGTLPTGSSAPSVGAPSVGAPSVDSPAVGAALGSVAPSVGTRGSHEPETIELPVAMPTVPIAPRNAASRHARVWPIVLAASVGLLIVSIAGWWLAESDSPTDSAEPSANPAESHTKTKLRPLATEPPASTLGRDERSANPTPLPSGSPSLGPSVAAPPSASAGPSTTAPQVTPYPVPRPPPVPTDKRRTFRRRLR